MMRYTLISLLVLATFQAGCDDSFSPFVDGPTNPTYVLNGLLDASADTQFVRVQIVRREVVSTNAVAGEVSVESIYPTSGTVIPWRDSLAVMDDGSIGHLFFAVFNPRAGEPITLRAFGADGETSVTQTIPETPNLIRSTPLFGPAVISEQMTLTGFDARPDELSIRYVVVDPVVQNDRVVDISYENTPGLRRIEGWQFPIVFSADRLRVASALGFVTDTPIVVRSVGLRITEFGPEWNDRRPSEVGFVGTIGRFTIPIELDPVLADSLNYIY